LAGRVRSYGYYAKKIGLDPARESIVLGPAFHAIGGVCVLAGIPVAPLYYVKREDGAWRGVFQSDPLEALRVLPYYKILFVAAREGRYEEEGFQRVFKGLTEILPQSWSPHFIWHYAIVNSFDESGQTYFERSLDRYRCIVDEVRNRTIPR